MTEIEQHENSWSIWDPFLSWSRGGDRRGGGGFFLQVLTFNRIELIPHHLLRHERSHLGTLWLSHRYQSHGNLRNENWSYYLAFVRDGERYEESLRESPALNFPRKFGPIFPALPGNRGSQLSRTSPLSWEGRSFETNSTERGWTLRSWYSRVFVVSLRDICVRNFIRLSQNFPPILPDTGSPCPPSLKVIYDISRENSAIVDIPARLTQFSQTRELYGV